MPGFVNYWYKDGETPAHTKSSFHKFKILTVHNIIAKNALILMHKINHFPETIPRSIKNCFPCNRPTITSNHESCEDWLKIYNDIPYRSSVFYKGPILATNEFNQNILAENLASLFSVKIYKNAVKKSLLSRQLEGNDSEWPAFLIFNLAGLRQSSRSKNKNCKES